MRRAVAVAVALWLVEHLVGHVAVTAFKPAMPVCHLCVCV